ncbi:MAG: serine hydroxymethyltransferase, partial [Candidatus Paceibacterota bacterium]
ENPVPLFDVVTTTTHKTLRGPRGAIIMCKEQFAKDINRAVFPGLQGGPHDHINAAKAVAFKEALEPSFKNYAKRIIVNAQTLASELQKFGFRIISGGTDNHLMLIDMTSRGLSGKEAEIALDKAGLSTNKNMIPFDTRKPLDPSGIRLGTPAITTRGMKEKEIIQIASWINDAVTNFDNDVKLNSIKNEVKNLAQKFPVPGI